MNLQFLLYRAYENRWKIVGYSVATLVGIGMILGLVHDIAVNRGSSVPPMLIGLGAGLFVFVGLVGVQKIYRHYAPKDWSDSKHRWNQALLMCLTLVFVITPVTEMVFVKEKQPEPSVVAVPSLHDRLVQFCAAFNAKGPILLDPETRMEGVRLGPEDEVIYTIRAFQRDMKGQNIDAMMLDARNRLVANYRNAEGLWLFRKNGVVMRYEYFDKNNLNFANIRITPADLNTPAPVN